MVELLVFAWLAGGGIGWLVLCGYWWRREMDLEAEDAAFFGFLAVVAGPFFLVAAVCLSLVVLAGDALKAFGFRGNAVVWRRRA